jgi:DcmR-like sensory protein
VVGIENLNAGHHVVQFYGHDKELAERVAGYVLGALEGGGVAIVIATPEHRHEFGTRLAQAGADLAAAGDRGAYLVLDAAETLRELMTADGLDGAAFDRVIGTLIRQAGAGGRPVRAYGELVALLWDDGLVSAAAQLEGMWDELGRRHPFSLFCGYRAGSVTRDIDAFAEVCRLHAEVIGSPAAAGPGGPAAVRRFAFSRYAPAAARHYTVATLHEWGDASPLRGAELRPAPLHGLGAVDALASRWGVESLGSAGKTVWVDLRR